MRITKKKVIKALRRHGMDVNEYFRLGFEFLRELKETEAEANVEETDKNRKKEVNKWTKD